MILSTTKSCLFDIARVTQFSVFIRRNKYRLMYKMVNEFMVFIN